MSSETPIRAYRATNTSQSSEVGSRGLLSAATAGHLAHEFRSELHTILGHAELLALDATDQDARDSTEYICDAAERLRGLCDDLTDLLQLPTLVDRGEIPLVLGALVESLTPIAADRGSRVRLLEPYDDDDAVVVDATTYRIVSHVIERVVRMANSDVMLRASVRSPGDACMITVAPAPEGIAVDSDSVVAIAAALLAARGGHLGVVGWRLELLVPVLEYERGRAMSPEPSAGRARAVRAVSSGRGPWDMG